VSYRGKSSSSRGRLRRRGRGRWSHVSARRLSQPDADIADDRWPEVNGTGIRGHDSEFEAEIRIVSAEFRP